MAEAYETQDRGGEAAYERYLKGMDASVRQKVALTAAHLLCEGQLADMGMGSGSGSHALASLYPDLHVTGVDVNPGMVERARERYLLPNLRFVQGDIAEPCFPSGSQEAILNSSVLHHVTSFNQYDREAAARAITVQADQLAKHGVLIVRDFVDPGPGAVWLDLPVNDGTEEAGQDSDDPQHCSTAALFERFAREFRGLRDPASERGFPYRRVETEARCPLRPGFRRYEVEYTHAVEFLLRKDYRADWDTEIREEYTYATQAEFEALFQRLGLRVLASTPLRNPWIVKNRYRDKFELWDVDTCLRLDDPPTNYVIVGQKVDTGQGVRLVEAQDHPRIDYLELTHYRKVGTGQVYDLARRPNTTIDVLPWFVRNGFFHVLARRSYPRPIPCARAPGPTSIDGSTPAAYLSELLNVQQGDKPLGQTVEELLCQFQAISSDGILRFETGSTYYPSPGGLQEQIRSVLVQVRPVNVQTQLDSVSGFSSSGQLRAIEARQALRAAQVGGLPECRLEHNVYELLRHRGMDPGPWIGEAIELSARRLGPVTSLDQLLGRASRRLFRRVAKNDSTGFLDVRCARFDELNDANDVVASRILEFVVPRPLSRNTVAVAPLCCQEGEILLGVDDDDLPAAQCFVGNSELLVAPAWRLPHEVVGIRAPRAWICDQLRHEYGAVVADIWELGGRYHPSPGVTPEVVYPLAARIERIEAGAPLQLHWVPLREIVDGRDELRDGHLLTLALRTAHAVGLLAQ